ncbi:hypothetical protein H310_09997 [Aphanomyces invadans]|uniref:SURF1-like protein n=1 Tax=Aphanomyces invadans TaxID=157072 RepID=A0A024TT67_9STRA|nr:hypothetical protein H310_09997 [Aphanomyces invadans]ETV97209.1 hypothetical protein H310_09997 [Aphanomyces invadans]|eukprot:XP_008874455.1 hypothetical protein H310_09997 [Aphanomyces invadans]
MQKVGAVVFSSIVVGTAGMGVWQTNRYFWKLDVIEQRKKQLDAPVIALPDTITAATASEGFEFRPLKIEGSFVPGSAFYLYPRSPPIDMQDTKGGRVSSGGYIYQLFQRLNGTSVIVNRGWLPKPEMEAHMNAAAAFTAAPKLETIMGLMVQGEEEKTFSPPNEPEKRHFFWLDQPQLARAMGSTDYVPILIDELAADEDAPRPAGEPIRKSKYNYLEFYMTPWKHATYAGIWFTLAILGTGMVFTRFRPAARRVKQYPLQR